MDVNKRMVLYRLSTVNPDIKPWYVSRTLKIWGGGREIKEWRGMGTSCQALICGLICSLYPPTP
uniref:Uncharacterized protein n=1 Tax=Anguilla anguilla TaxID=7936 RepID=A0A0E9QRC9_ANGAN